MPMMRQGDMNTRENTREPILTLEEVSKTFKPRRSLLKEHGEKVVALNRVSFEIYEGEIFGLVGESGSGKTTAGRLMVKLEEPDSGTIRLLGKDISRLKGTSLKDFRRKVQMIFQDPYQSLNPYLSVFDTVSEPLTIHRLGDGETRRNYVLAALKSVGLTPAERFLLRYPHQLSGGQRQRVAVARAMVLRPAFVIADEPTSMLDASVSMQMFSIMAKIRKITNVSFLFITHSLAAARFLCDRIAVIYRGEILETGPVEDIINNPCSEYTKALIKAQPGFDFVKPPSPKGRA